MKIENKEKILPIIYVMLSILFVLPSINYLINNKTLFGFNTWFDFLFNKFDNNFQTITYIIILLAITITYVIIIKKRNKIFKNIKSVLKYIAIIGTIYIFAIPFTSSDVFYYMGIGRLDSTYNQNPYYTTIQDFVNNEKENPKEEIEQDTVLMQGYLNHWSNTTVVYGPAWQLICKLVGFLSFGNLELGMLVFKILALIVHVINTWLIYKLTGKKIFAIIYGLNPFVLIEGIMCVHNDIFVVLFTLVALYFMKKKKLWASMIALAMATAIKYFTVLLLPFIIIYYFRKEKPSIRFIKGVMYGTIFVVALIVLYLLYMKDLNILNGIVTQQGKIAKSWYLLISEYFPQLSVDVLSGLLLKIFAIIYIFTCITLLFKKEIKLNQLMGKYAVFLLFFIFGLITQFMPWYLMWLMPIFMWQKPNTLRTYVALGIISEFANAIFLLNNEGYIYGIPYCLTLYTATLGYALYIEKQKNRRKNFGQISFNRWK